MNGFKIVHNRKYIVLMKDYKNNNFMVNHTSNKGNLWY